MQVITQENSLLNNVTLEACKGGNCLGTVNVRLL